MILDILKAMADPELSDQEKSQVMLEILYWDPEEIPIEYLNEALEKGKEFIDCGITGEGKNKVQLMDWEQDSPIIAPAVNKNIGKDIRSLNTCTGGRFLGLIWRLRTGCSARCSIFARRKPKERNWKNGRWNTTETIRN